MALAAANADPAPTALLSAVRTARNTLMATTAGVNRRLDSHVNDDHEPTAEPAVPKDDHDDHDGDDANDDEPSFMKLNCVKGWATDVPDLKAQGMDVVIESTGWCMADQGEEGKGSMLLTCDGNDLYYMYLVYHFFFRLSRCTQALFCIVTNISLLLLLDPTHPRLIKQVPQ
jgi:hypothetical protein